MVASLQAAKRVENYADYSTTSLNNEDLGDNWVALARPLSRPYQEAELISADPSDGWIVITPNTEWKSLKQINEQDPQGEIYAHRTIKEVVKANTAILTKGINDNCDQRKNSRNRYHL